LSTVALPARQYFYILSHKRHDFRGKKLEDFKGNVRSDFLYNSVSNIPHFKKNWARYDQKYISVFMWSARYSRKIFEKKNFNSLERSSKNAQIHNFMNIRPAGAEMFHADGRTDMTKLIATIRKFQKAQKMVRCSLLIPATSISRHYIWARLSFSLSLSLSLKEFTHYLLSVSPSTTC